MTLSHGITVFIIQQARGVCPPSRQKVLTQRGRQEKRALRGKMRLPNVKLVLDQRRRHWSTTNPTLSQRVVVELWLF